MDSSGSKRQKTNINKLRETHHSVISMKQNKNAIKIEPKRRANIKLIKYWVGEMKNSVDSLKNKSRKSFQRGEQKRQIHFLKNQNQNQNQM